MERSFDFTKTFSLECDTFDKGIEVVLMQEGCPLVFTSEKLCDIIIPMKKELLVVIHVVDMWFP